MRRTRGLHYVALLMMAGAGMASAETEVDFSGFASIGAGRVSDASIEFYDYDNEWSFDSDSMLALQAVAEVSQKVSFTGQILSKGFTFDNRSPYEPELNWLFASYEVTEALRARAGRLRTPLFLFSESLDAGFSYPWVRPPVNMYANFLEPFDNYDGIDITWFTQWGQHETEFGFFAGTTEEDYRGRDINVHKTFALTAQTQVDAFKLRYCYNWNRISIFNPVVEPAADGYRFFAALLNQPIYDEIANNAQLDAQVLQYHALGLQWERDGWQIIAEKFQTVSPEKQFSFDNAGWYVSVARQIQDVMPYVTIGEYGSGPDHHIRKLVASTYNVTPEGWVTPLDALRTQTLTTLENMTISQSSIAMGLRYEITSQSALKFEAEYFHLNSAGQMTFVGDGSRPDHALATTLVFDVVFR
jgi:hypothetical protein